MKIRASKIKIHFNRINMQRGNPNVWTVHYKGTCYQVANVTMHGPFRTVFAPKNRQPRAWFEGIGYIEVFTTMTVPHQSQAVVEGF